MSLTGWIMSSPEDGTGVYNVPGHYQSHFSQAMVDRRPKDYFHDSVAQQSVVFNSARTANEAREKIASVFGAYQAKTKHARIAAGQDRSKALNATNALLFVEAEKRRKAEEEAADLREEIALLRAART